MGCSGDAGVPQRAGCRHRPPAVPVPGRRSKFLSRVQAVHSRDRPRPTQPRAMQRSHTLRLIKLFLAMKFVKTISFSAPVLAHASLLAAPSQAQYLFADPTGFSAQAVGSPFSYNFIGTGDLSVNVVSKGDGISFGTSTVNFQSAGTSNPSWMGGSRRMFRFEYDGSTSGGPRELAELEFIFSTPLSTQSYLLLTDFDSYEGLAIAAYNTSNSLVPFNAFLFSRHDGEEPLGDTFVQPSWSATNPTQSSQWVNNNSPWTGVNSITGFLQDTSNSSVDDPAVSLQPTTEISRIVFYYNAESINGTGSNTLRFNFAAPVPGPLPIVGVGAAFGFSRKLRRRIKSASCPMS